MLELLLIILREEGAALRSHIARRAPMARLKALRLQLIDLWFAGREWLWRLQPAPVPGSEPAPRTREDHFARMTGLIAGAISSFERIDAWQSAASDQIDAADYSLHLILGELATAMPLPVDGAPLRAILAEAAKPSRAAKKALAA